MGLPAALAALALSLLQPEPAVCGPEEDPSAVCAPGADAAAPRPPGAQGPQAAETATAAAKLTFYWGVGCPHCEEAKPLVAALRRERPELRIEEVEIRRDAAGRARFVAEVERLGIAAPGIPLFVSGDAFVLGFSPGRSEAAVRALAAPPTTSTSAPAAPSAVGDGAAIEVPLLGRVEPARVSLLALTATVGLVDGINPCAIWVLVVLLGMLAHVRSRARILLFGGLFVLVSGVVYFTFMTAWSGLFAALGGSRAVSAVLGTALAVMGLVNLKEIFWFKRGVSFVIPEAAKPALYRRMRGIAHATSLPAALAGVLVLALLANLVELGCTIGLPALYTRALSLRAELEPWRRVAWIALYNVFYVVPLAAIVVAWAAASRRMVLGERGARALKGVSGAMLLAFGLVLLLAPQLLG